MATILVIDDDEDIRALVRAILEPDGHRVIEAPDGDDGLEQFTADPAALVVIDLFMPNKGGWETLRELQRKSPGLPFLLISGGAALEVVRKGSPGTLASLEGLAAYQVLLKPFGTDELRLAVGSLLRAAGASDGRRP